MKFRDTLKFVVGGLVVMAAFSTAHAADSNKSQLMKPLQGISFKAGTMYGVGYFYNEAKHCKLVLTLAEEPDWNTPEIFSTVRHEGSLPAGAKKSFAFNEGKLLEFACGDHAETMTFREVDRVAAGAVK